MKKYLITVLGIIVLAGGSYGIFEAVNAQQSVTKKTVAQQTVKKPTTSTEVVVATPMDVINNPQKYLNKNIKMKATFDKFSTLGLDYKPALRKSEDYIGILIRRDDITDHVMPLPEMKIFLKRKVAEKYIDLETGDKIVIEGKVFSNALSDAWIDVTKLTIISSKKPIKAS